MNSSDILAVIDRLDWTFAKTMPENPHEYTIRDKARDPADFARLYAAIEEHGSWERWNGRRYRYLYPGDGWRYWILGSRYSFLVNRARVG